MINDKSIESKTRGTVIRKEALYSMVANHVKEAVNRTVELLHSKNDSVALGAAKLIIDKCLADKKPDEEEIRKEIDEIKRMLLQKGL